MSGVAPANGTQGSSAGEGPPGGIVIGVTGAPGSGKTAAASAFAELGARMVPLDAIGHELLCDEEVREEIRGTFSSGVFRIMDGEVSRRKLADVVFGDAEELGKLNRILHPRMVERVRSEVERWRGPSPRQRGFGPAGGWDASGGAGALVVEGALLIEMGLADLCDRVVLVTAPREARLDRLRRARGWDEEELSRREGAQLDEGARRARADAVVENAGGLDMLRQKIVTLWREWR